MATVMTNFNDTFFALLENLASERGMSVSEFIRETMIERIEDEQDLRDAKEALKELEEDPTLYDFEELKAEWMK